MSKLLITGASGFIGGFIVEEALKRGFETWAAVRKGSSTRYLRDERIRLVELDLSDPEALRGALRGSDFDYVVHAAGLTKSPREADFFRVNTDGTINLAEAVRRECPNLRRFVYLSSLSVMGPAREDTPHADITDDDEPRPNTAYGLSKLMGERALDAMRGFPCVTLRPTGVYGPREKDYFMMVKSISRHVDFAAGYKPQHLTFVYVVDVVEAVFLALERGKTGSKYFLSDGDVYSSRDFSDLIRRELGNPPTLRVTAPLWLLRAITLVGECVGRLTGKVTALNNDKYNIMRQRNWRCDITPATTELGYTPRHKLDEGTRLTVRWYKDNGWI